MPRTYNRKSYDYRPAVLIGAIVASLIFWGFIGYTIAHMIAG